MASPRHATARQLDPEPEFAPAEDTRRRWLNATSQLATDHADEVLGTFVPSAPSRARRAPAAPRPAAAPAPATERLTYRPAQEVGVPFAQQRAAQAPARHTAPPATRVKLAGLAAGAVVGVLALYVALSALFGFTQTKLDDLQYGRPRTTHLDAYVGHAGEQAGQPSHFLALNLDRRIVVIELPGGDTKDAITITGPYLFGDGEDLTPAKLTTEDVNGDGQDDLLVTVKNEQLVYINDKSKNSFHLMTPEERTQLPATTSSGGGPPTAGAGR
ncbi:MAG TPA: hypothetical protein VM536_11785 [Chloroflexia bacterium]|nr:hypothetical protein [Chloroflexia bacterium]